ncbi:MAG TPA: phosphatase PAP2 family protein [Ilumatobacter sp.]|nr:phosphatase PAP2 family protein [Ilumatobacter sp.]
MRATWPIRRSDAGLLVGFYVAMTLLWTGIGALIKHSSDGTALGNADRDIEEWLVERRTPSRNTLSLVGSMLSETAIKIVVTAIVGVVLLWLLRRWFETLVIAVSLIIEAMIFMTVTLIVARPRPDVPRLDESPVSTSFPSGHVAAAACYGAMAVVLFWHTRRFWLRAMAVFLTLAIPTAVGVARMYRGMHYLTDVVGGAIIGAMCVVAVTWILKRAEARRLDEGTVLGPMKFDVRSAEYSDLPSSVAGRAGPNYSRSNRSRFMTFSQALTKSLANFSLASSEA